VSNLPAILFTGFEPSGDDHAASVIAELRRRHPDLPMYAWGGPKMEAAGAEIVEATGRDAVMGVPGLAKIQEHKRINARIEKWLESNPIAVHVPVDSPAANFPICRLTRATGARVVHLVAPQVWAWASWRVRKLRRLSNFVCCVLPFEEDWFRQRGVRSQFVGHPLFDKPLDLEALDASISDWPKGKPKLVLLPGSRPAEIRKNFPLLMASYRRIAREHPNIVGVVAATRADLEGTIRDLAGGPWPESLRFVSSQTDEAIRWADLALVVSGTVTLQVARQRTPMVVFYKLNWLMFNLLVRWLIRTPFLSLPNLIAGERIVPELIPHFGGADAIVDEAVGLLERPELVERQRAALTQAVAKFEGFSAACGAADIIERVAGLTESVSAEPALH
jgi:lipid-A-disaccharide synthase